MVTKTHPCPQWTGVCSEFPEYQIGLALIQAQFHADHSGMVFVSGADHIPKGMTAVAAVNQPDPIKAPASLQCGIDGDPGLMDVASMQINFADAADHASSSTSENRGPL